jgi:uncharacterized protein (TIGR02246 family)
MTDSNDKSSRRAFFLHGGAVLSVGAATTAGAAALVSGGPKDAPEDREAIRQLHLTFMAAMEDLTYEAVAGLFTDDAQLNLPGMSAAGKPDILGQLVAQYRGQQATQLHSAYRQTAAQRKDTVTFDSSGQRAAATFHAEVEISTPLRADCTAAQMARLQGQMASRRWEPGRFEARYLKRQGEWKILSLRYRALPDVSTARPG